MNASHTTARSSRSVAEPPKYPYVHVDAPSAATDELAAELFELGATGLEQRDDSTLAEPDSTSGGTTLVASFPSSEQARRAAETLRPRYPARLRVVIGDEWRDRWRRYFKPARIGARLLVRPSWEPVTPWPGEVVLTLDPGRAFGSGTHETTRLVLRELDRFIRGGERVLDVGCGSGILSVAALLLGAVHVRAVDIEPQAIEATRENARLNRVASRLSATTAPIERIRGRYDLVVANIEADPLVRHADALAGAVGPGGTLVLSGVLLGRQERVRDAYPGLRGHLLRRNGDWVALVLHRDD